MIHTSHVAAADQLIAKYGKPVSIDTSYYVAEVADIGDSEIVLSDVFGILEGHVLETPTESLTVASVSGTTVTLLEPITAVLNIGDSVSGSVDTLAVPATTGKSLTRDTLEFNKRIRVPKETLVNYGSKVNYIRKDFFVTGYEISDLSLSLKLRAIDGTVDIYRLEQGDDNGFSYDTVKTVVAEGVDAYFEYASGQTRPKPGAGYIPSTYQTITLPGNLTIQLGDQVTRQGDVFKVVGLDRYRIRNLLTLVVDYDLNRE